MPRFLLSRWARNTPSSPPPSGSPHNAALRQPAPRPRHTQPRPTLDPDFAARIKKVDETPDQPPAPDDRLGPITFQIVPVSRVM